MYYISKVYCYLDSVPVRGDNHSHELENVVYKRFDTLIGDISITVSIELKSNEDNSTYDTCILGVFCLFLVHTVNKMSESSP